MAEAWALARKAARRGSGAYLDRLRFCRVVALLDDFERREVCVGQPRDRVAVLRWRARDRTHLPEHVFAHLAVLSVLQIPRAPSSSCHVKSEGDQISTEAGFDQELVD